MDGFALLVVSLCKHLHCKENYFFNFLGSVKPFVEQLQRIFAGEASVLEPLRESGFITDLLLTFI